MESIPAAAIPVVVATDAQPSRDVVAGEAVDSGTFGQALEKELSAANGEITETPPDATAAGVVSPEILPAADGTLILDVILDSSGMLASAAAAAAATPTQVADPLDARADAVAETGEVALTAARGPRVGDYIRPHVRLDLPAETAGRAPATTDAGTARPEAANARTDGLPDTAEIVAAAEEQPDTVSSMPTQPRGVAAAVAAAVAPSDRALEAARALASAGSGPMPQILASLDKTLAPSKPAGQPGTERLRVQDGSPSAVREELKTRAPSDELSPPRIDLRSERPVVEPAGLPPTSGAVPAPDSTPQPRDVGVTLDALTSAALMQRATPVSHQSPAASATPAIVRVDTPLSAPGWTDAFRQQVVWLVDRQLETAELHVNPPHLGPVDVVLKLSDDGARIAFCSPHAAVREAIEASLPDLRSGLAERGLTLGQALVSADPGSAREQMMRDENVREGPRVSDDAQSEPEREMRTVPLRRGLVDTFV